METGILDDRVKQAHDMIDQAMARYHTDLVFGAFSGGHDSLTSTHIASQHPAFKGVVHINTGIGVPETRQFVERTCQDAGWSLHVAAPSKLRGYVQNVLRFGFPGPAGHAMMYRELKNKPLSKLLTTLRDRPGRNVILCTGMRRQESARRMMLTEAVRKEANIIWLSHIFDWTGADCTLYMLERRLQRNPVKDRLHISGECLCGCFADRNERQELRDWYPHVDEEITKIERLVRYAADLNLQDYRYPDQQATWGWGSGNYEAQEMAKVQPTLPMCHYCHAGRLTSLLDDGTAPVLVGSER